MDETPPLTGIKLFLGLIGVCFGTMMITVDQFIVNVSISTISGELGVSNNNGTWSITAYTVANAISIPLTGWFCARIGTMRTLMFSSLFFAFFSFMCGASIDLQMLIIMRILQGLAGGPLIPIGQAVILRLLPHKKAAAMGIFGLIVMVGPALGPVLGGWITFTWNWRPIFYINVPIGILVAAIIWAILYPLETKKSKPAFDTIGMILLVVGFGSFQIMLDKGYDLDWFKSYAIRALGVCALVGITAYVIWDWYSEKALMKLSLLKQRNFTLGNILISVPMFIVFSNLVVGPLWVQENLGYTPEWAGFTLAPLGVTAIICFPLVGIFLHKIDTRIWVFMSFCLLFLSLYVMSLLNIHTPFKYMAWSRLIMGMGFAFFYVPLATITLSCLSSEDVPEGSVIFSFTRMLAVSCGVSLGTNYWYRTANFFQSRYVEYMIPSNPQFVPFIQLLKPTMGIEGITSEAFIYQMVIFQAQTESYLQLCYISALAFIPAACLLLFVSMKEEHKGKMMVAE